MSRKFERAERCHVRASIERIEVPEFHDVRVMNSKAVLPRRKATPGNYLIVSHGDIYDPAFASASCAAKASAADYIDILNARRSFVRGRNAHRAYDAARRPPRTRRLKLPISPTSGLGTQNSRFTQLHVIMLTLRDRAGISRECRSG
jgi:aspartyl-tRNA(Asn)/glutamyl-tRNA(Gln) amidotransferase subunit A